MEEAVEVRAAELPPATLETLKRLRIENCSRTSKDFKLQSFQLFLRRILSADSPVRNMLLFHGTGVGKTCTAIQVAEEYILRPEFQDKKVLVLASAAVQENFRTQIFDVTRVNQDQTGLLQSQQCTGRRYLDMLERAQSEWLRWENPENREKLNSIIQTMIDDFYEFKPYQGWANLNESKQLTLSPKEFEQWIHQTYDNRLIIVDEAHNLREGEDSNKAVSDTLKKIVQIANGVTLVLLSATPMYDSFDEILFFFNMFLWNDKKQTIKELVKVSDIFNSKGDFKNKEAETVFRNWCHEYISFLRGENPFTFPFRLPPPSSIIAKFDRVYDIKGKKIENPRKYIPLTVSYLESPQMEYVSKIKGTINDSSIPTIVVAPDGRNITKCFERSSDLSKAQFRYAKDVPPFLSLSNLAKHSAKFQTIINCITDTSGIVFVYSNYVRGGVQQFAMALEEAGFEPATGLRMLENISGEYKGTSSRGKYAFLTSDMREKQIEQLIQRVRRPENSKGQDIRIILASPLVSEGIDFKNVRQIHILDPWYNMSRLEQIIGRGLRTCSHASLPFEEQNCTVYLHIVRYKESVQETYDEHMYRVFVEDKAKKISHIKQIISESAIDCSSQISTNFLPEQWRELPIPQTRSQDQESLTLPLSAMSAPTFEDGNIALVCRQFEKSNITDYIRPLGAYFDIKDDVFDKIIEMFEKKPIWSTEDLLKSKNLQYEPEVVQFLLDDAVHTHLRLKDSNGRVGTLENRDGMYAFKPDTYENATMLERYSDISAEQGTEIIDVPEEKEEEKEEEESDEEEEPSKFKTLEEIQKSISFPFDTSEFSDEIKLWYTVDQTISAEEKIHLLQTLKRDSESKPLWGKDVFADDLLVISTSKVFNSKNEEITPVGSELDSIKEWTDNHIDKIVEEIKSNKIMCTLENRVLKIAAFEVVDGHISRIKRTKTITPKACPFFVQTSLTALVKDCLGHDFPVHVKTKEMQCTYLSLAIRKAATSSSEHVFWVSPEVWSYVSKESAKVRSKIA